MGELRLSLEDGIKYLKKHKINQVDIHLKYALAPNSLKVRYLSSIIMITNSDYNIPDNTVLFPYDSTWQPKVDMYFEDGLSLTPISTDSYRLMEMHSPFEQKHMAGRYKGTAKEKALLFLSLVTALEKNGIKYGFSGWGGIQEMLTWFASTLDYYNVQPS